ncbi:hypothetical protein [Maioricimonas rarisocia]|uniref:hypothetical protein n=1 Tax=Maioricimonas rarisocia TaxID=2528026 RepID=UPI0011A5616E|nr:hypothetical protein [Maioricimonas rarisocia]
MGVTVLAAAAVSLAAGSQWAEQFSAGPFQFRSEFAMDEAERQSLASEIALLRDDLEQTLRLPPGESPVEVSLFRNKWSYQRFVSQRIPDGASRPALFVKGPDLGRVYIYRRWGYETDFRHECTHALLHSSLPFVPLWLDEGLAEYFEIPRGERASRGRYLSSLRRSMFFGWKPNLRRLEARQSVTEMDSDDYRDSWAWVHFLLHGPVEARQVLSNYLDDIHSGRVITPFSERLYQRVPDANQQLILHLRSCR